MQKSLLLFVAFVFLFAFGGALASALEIVNVADIAAVPADIITSSFVISNSDPTLNVTGMACSVSIQGWSTSCSCPSELAYNSSETANFSVGIPRYTAPGTYTGIINISGTLNNAISEDSASFNVNVSVAPNIEISWLQGPTNLYQGESQLVELNVTNTGNILLDTGINVTSVPELIFSSTSVMLGPGASKEINLTIETSSSTKIGIYTIKASAFGKNETANITKESEKSFAVFYQYCVARESGNISLQSVVNENDIKDKEFKPLDTFNIEVRVQNSDSEKRYAVVEAVILYKSNEIDETAVKEKVKIEDYDSEKVTLTVKLPSDAEEGYYYLYVKAYDDDNRNNCQQREIRFSVGKENYLVTPYSVAIEPTKVSCDQLFKVSGRVANIGSHDESKVKVIYEDDLGNSYYKVFNDLEKGTLSSLFSFQPSVPKDAKEGSHPITLHLYYDYDEVSGDYEKNKKYEYYLTVEGNCYKKAEEEEKGIKVSLTTQLVELVGKKVSVYISVKNTGYSTATYAVDVTCDWAVIDSISQAEITIEPNQSRSVIIELTPKEEVVEGIYYLTVGLGSGETRITKSVPINVQTPYLTWGQKLGSLLGGAGKGLLKLKTLVQKMGGDWLWLVIDIVLILIVIAIVVRFIIRPRRVGFHKFTNE